MGSTVSNYPRNLTFRKVWASIHELRESQKETDRQQKETDKQLKETFQKIDERADRLDKQLGEMGNRFGDMIEHMMRPGIQDKLKAYGFLFTEVSFDKSFGMPGNKIAEADVFLENMDKVMAVEIKSKPDIDDIKDHIERMNKLRSWADAKGDKRGYYAAMGGMIIGEDV